MKKGLLTSLSILCFISLTLAHKFQTTDPLAYQVTNHAVADEVFEYVIDFTAINPCPELGKADDSFTSVLSGEYHEQVRLQERCQTSFREEWLKLIKEIPNLHEPHNNYLVAMKKLRTKRAIGIDDAILATSGFTLGICTSNMFRSVLNFFGYKDATTQHLDDQDKHLKRIDAEILTFKQKFDMTVHINELMIKSLKQLTPEVYKNKQEI